MSKFALRSWGPAIVTLLLGGCALSGTMFHGPEVFDTSTNVFSGVKSDSLPQGGAPDSRLAKVYEVPYYDVFREAKVAAVQAQLFVEKADESDGLIFAAQSRPVDRIMGAYVDPGMSGSGWIVSEKRFYLIALEEVTGESTKVTILDKVQYECRGEDKGWVANTDLCRSMTNVQWPTGNMKSVDTLETFHNMLSNNLIAAGLL